MSESTPQNICAYCGFIEDAGQSPQERSEKIVKHVLVCEKRPEARMAAEIVALKNHLTDAEARAEQAEKRLEKEMQRTDKWRSVVLKKADQVQDLRAGMEMYADPANWTQSFHDVETKDVWAAGENGYEPAQAALARLKEQGPTATATVPE